MWKPSSPGRRMPGKHTKEVRMVAKTLILVCAAALALGGAAGGSTVTTLRGTVGPGFTIKLTKAGKPVTRLAPGMYRIVVSDRSAIHNFVIEKSGGAFE